MANANTPIPAHDSPMMLGVSTHAHVPAHAHTNFPSVPPQANVWPTTGYCIPVAPASYDESHHVKRVRDGQQLSSMQEDDSYLPPVDGMASPSCGKKQRPSNYQPPRHVDKKSVVAATGSLVGGGWDQSTTMVRMRRELSGGQLDQFFRSHDDMEVEQDPITRPRSMSF